MLSLTLRSILGGQFGELFCVLEFPYLQFPWGGWMLLLQMVIRVCPHSSGTRYCFSSSFCCVVFTTHNPSPQWLSQTQHNTILSWLLRPCSTGNAHASFVLTNSFTSDSCHSEIFALPSVHHLVTVPLKVSLERVKSQFTEPWTSATKFQETRTKLSEVLPSILAVPAERYIPTLPRHFKSSSNYQYPLGLSFLFHGLEIGSKLGCQEPFSVLSFASFA